MIGVHISSLSFLHISVFSAAVLFSAGESVLLVSTSALYPICQSGQGERVGGVDVGRLKVCVFNT